MMTPKKMAALPGAATETVYQSSKLEFLTPKSIAQQYNSEIEQAELACKFLKIATELKGADRHAAESLALHCGGRR